MGKYDFELNMEENNTNPIIINQISEETEVLEFGSANGRLTKYLTEMKKCKVDIVEIDEESGRQASRYARHFCVGKVDGDIEKYNWAELLKGNQYDYIIFADVLEHLSNPKKVLISCKDFLKTEGKLLISIPNIAHNAILANLCKDRFDYKETGLLDYTHVHFFTYHSARQLFDEIEMEVVNEDAVYHSIEETEFQLSYANLSENIRSIISRHSMGNVYQFVFTLARQGRLESRLIPINNYCYFAKIYYIPIIEDDFLEENSIVIPIDVNQTSFNIPLNKNIKGLRIDPINVPAFMQIDSIEIEQENEIHNATFITNAVCFEEDKVYITDENFQILIKDIQGGVESVRCNFKYLYYDMGCFSMIKQHWIENQREVSDRINTIYHEKEKIENRIIYIENEKSELLCQMNEIETQKLSYAEELKIIYNSRSWKMIQFIRKMFGRK